jgi:hypothetical protein
MSDFGKPGAHIVRYSGVYEGFGALAVDAGSVDRCLNTHSEVDVIHERMEDAARDPVTPRSGSGEHPDPPALCSDCGSGEDWRLARRDAVSSVTSRVEVAHGVVQEEAALGDEHERAKRRRDGCDDGGNVSFVVGRHHAARAGKPGGRRINVVRLCDA